ncbi:hypothetical protein Hanom_Chr01g00058261 [Helianthus anomalus]
MRCLGPRIGIVSICNPRGGARKGTAHTIEKLVIVEKQLTRPEGNSSTEKQQDS